MPDERWLVLVQRLPKGADAARVKAWRTLRRCGAVALRDGTYIVPKRMAEQACLQEAVQVVEQAGGSAALLHVTCTEHLSDADLQALFNEARDQDYAGLEEPAKALADRVREAAEQGDRLALDRLHMQLMRLRENWQGIRRVDFFGARFGEVIRRRLDESEAAIERALSPDEPTAESPAEPRRLDREAWTGCLWVTRRRPWIDRLASAWLIRRFIDPAARFAFIEPKAEAVPEGGISFDMQQGEFSHRGEWVTFETLMHDFGLADMPGLPRIAQLVHDLDLKQPEPPREAEGLVRLLVGARLTAPDDHALLEVSAQLFDLLFEASRSAE